MKMITGNNFSITFSLAATNEEKVWLKTGVAPGAAPNYEFWCPVLCSGIYLPASADAGSGANVMGMAVKASYTVECRGTKMNATY